MQRRVYRNRKVPTIAREDVRDLIIENKGKFFSCEFTKKDGSSRVLHGRTGVKKGLTGTGTPRKSKSLVAVWEKAEKSYRSVNIDTMSKITLQHKTFKVV